MNTVERRVGTGCYCLKLKSILTVNGRPKGKENTALFAFDGKRALSIALSTGEQDL